MLDCYDAFLRNSAVVERLSPDVVLRFGPIPTSKPLLQYLQHHRSCRQISIDPAGWHDPGQLLSDQVRSEPRLFCDQLAALRSDFRASRARRPPIGSSNGGKPTGSPASTVFADAWPKSRSSLRARFFTFSPNSFPMVPLLFAGNSMPVRDLDAFFPSNNCDLRFLANRGAGGIDGVVSSALGACAVSAGPLVLVVGDLSFFHDSNGLLAAKKHGLDATIIVLNNDGGGIFSFLPQAEQEEHFETLFGTPHGSGSSSSR